MMETSQETVEASRVKLLDSLGDSNRPCFFRAKGNIGDDLIYAGIRQLLSSVSYDEISIRECASIRGDTAIIAGGGSWCTSYCAMPEYLRVVESNFKRVVVFPSSFDTSVPSVRETLSKSNALIFARERESYRQIKDLCNADVAQDCAMFFDYQPYLRKGEGVLHAFRTDHDAKPFALPSDNDDISRTCESLDQWLWTIARHETVRTDRAHVTVAAAMLEKNVEYCSTRYHKVPEMVAFSLQGLPVRQLNEQDLESLASENDRLAATPWRYANADQWWDEAARAGRELAELADEDSVLVVVDDSKLGDLGLGSRRCVPFLERGGYHWGAPPDDETALQEFHRLRELNPEFLVFTWPAFWWFDHYLDFSSYVHGNFECVLRNERLVVFNLRGEVARSGKVSTR